MIGSYGHRLIPFLLVLGLFLNGAGDVTAGDGFERTGDIAVGQGPGQMLLGDSLYVCLGEEDAIGVIDSVDRTRVDKIQVGDVPVAMSLLPGGRKMAVACFGSDQVQLLDLTSGRVIQTAAVSDGPRSMALLPRSGLLLVSCYFGGKVDILDVHSLKSVASIEADVGLHHVLATPDEKRAFVMDSSRDRMLVIDLASRQIEKVLTADDGLGVGQWDMKLTPDGRTLVVSNWSSNTLTLIDTGKALVLGQIETGGKGAAPLGLGPRGQLALVGHSEDDSVSLIDLREGRLLGQRNIGRFPFSAAAISPDGRFGLVTNDNARSVSVMQLSPFKEVGRVTTGRIPRTILFQNDSSRAYVANTQGNTISILEPVRREPDSH